MASICTQMVKCLRKVKCLCKANHLNNLMAMHHNNKLIKVHRKLHKTNDTL